MYFSQKTFIYWLPQLPVLPDWDFNWTRSKTQVRSVTQLLSPDIPKAVYAIDSVEMVTSSAASAINGTLKLIFS